MIDIRKENDVKLILKKNVETKKWTIESLNSFKSSSIDNKKIILIKRLKKKKKNL